MSIQSELEQMVAREVSRQLAKLQTTLKTAEQMRREAGFTSIDEVASATGISSRTIRKWERRGIRKPEPMHDEMISRLARVYGCEVNALFAAIRRSA